MCTDLGIGISSDMDLCELLTTAIQGCIPAVGNEEVVAILHTRLSPQQLVDSDFWAVEEVVQCFDKGDAEVVESTRSRVISCPFHCIVASCRNHLRVPFHNIVKPVMRIF